MTTICQLENTPCNQGYIFAGQKIYGDLPATDTQDVKLLDVHTDKIHIWHRHCHTVFTQEPDKLRYETSNQMTPCPQEAMFGVCYQRFDEEHHKFFYHYCHGKPRFYEGKPVCRYSLVDKDCLCWERFNSEHNKNYHHSV